MNDFLLDLIIISVVGLIFFRTLRYFLTKPKKNSPERLYQSILHDGCPCDGSNLTIVHTVDMPYHRHRLIIECDECYDQYRLDHVDHRAWKHEVIT